MTDPDALRRSPCPISNALEVLGDKWSLLVVRDLLRGKHTYGELLNSPEGIPTNLLADRLRRMEKAGIVEKSVYRERPTRYAYALSDKGKALADVLRALTRWGKAHIPDTYTLGELASRSAEVSPPTASPRRAARARPAAGAGSDQRAARRNR